MVYRSEGDVSNSWYRRNYALMWFSCHLVIPLANAFITASMFMSIFISLDRVLAIGRPVAYLAKWQNKRYRVGALVLSLTIGFTLVSYDVNRFSLEFNSTSGIYSEDNNYDYQQSLFASIFNVLKNCANFGGLASLLVCNIAVVRLYRSRVINSGINRMMRRESEGCRSDADLRREAEQKQTERTLFILSVCQNVIATLSVGFMNTMYLFEYFTSNSSSRIVGLLNLGWPLSDSALMLAALLDFYVPVMVSKSLRRIMFPWCMKNNVVKPAVGVNQQQQEGADETALSAQDVFSRHMSKTRTRSGSSSINVAAIMKDVKKGAEVVKTMQSTFDTIQSEGKKVGELGELIFGEHSEIMDAGRMLANTLQGVAKYIGPALGGAGAIFAVISVFLPQSDSAELKAIQSGFLEMHQRFDGISNQLQQLDEKTDFIEAIRPYNEIGVIARRAIETYSELIQLPTSLDSWDKFNKSCDEREAENALTLLHELIVLPQNPQGKVPLVETLIRYYKLDYPVIMSWFERMVQYAYILATVRSSCFGAKFGKEDTGYGRALDKAETYVKEIITTLSDYEQKFTNIEEQYTKFLKDDLEAAIKIKSVSTADEQLANQYCEKVEALIPNIVPNVCRGKTEINTRRVSVNLRLRTKYYWLNWVVVVYEGSSTKHPCPDRQSGQRWYHHEDSSTEGGVIVSWARKDASAELEPIRQQGLSAVNKAAKEQGKYPQMRDQWVWMKTNAWIKQGPLGGKGIFCLLGGYTSEYRRSIATGGLIAHSRVGDKRDPPIPGVSMFMSKVDWESDYLVFMV